MPVKNSTLKNKPKVLLEWRSKAWPYIRRSPEFFRTVIVLAGLLVLITLLMKEFLAAIVIITLVFVVFAFSSVPPLEITHQVVEKGLQSGDHFYSWDQLTRFWFANRGEHMMLFIDTTIRFPSRVMLVAENVDQKKLANLLKEKLEPVDEPEPGFLDQAARYLARRIPLEK